MPIPPRKPAGTNFHDLTVCLRSREEKENFKKETEDIKI